MSMEAPYSNISAHSQIISGRESQGRSSLLKQRRRTQLLPLILQNGLLCNKGLCKDYSRQSHKTLESATDGHCFKWNLARRSGIIQTRINHPRLGEIHLGGCQTICGEFSRQRRSRDV